MEFQHYFMAIAGGLMAGSAAGWVLQGRNRITKMNENDSGLPHPRPVDAAWQAIFMLGLVAGGAVLTWLDPAGLPVGQTAPIELTIGAGLLVGFAARHDESQRRQPC